MALVRRPGSTNWHYEFQCGGRRFRGSAGTGNRRQAERVLRERRLEAQAEIERRAALAPGGSVPTLAEIAQRWWRDKGCHHSRPQAGFKVLARMVAEFGATTQMDAITTAKVMEARSRWRERLANGSVNRTLLEPLRILFNHHAATTDAPALRQPNWKQLFLPEPKELVREASPQHEALFFAQLPPGYRPVFRFSVLSGLRMAEAVGLQWSQVDLTAASIRFVQKGGAERILPLSREMVALLSLERGHHARFVFTYLPRRSRSPQSANIVHPRQPVTLSGVKTEWRKARQRLAQNGHDLGPLRWHDLRHTAATRLLRATGNLKLVSRALGHKNINTTMKYAHVFDEDIRQGWEAVSAAQQQMHDSPTPLPHSELPESRKNAASD